MQLLAPSFPANVPIPSQAAQRRSPTSLNRMWGCSLDVFRVPPATLDRATSRTRQIAFSRAQLRPTTIRPQPSQTPSPTSLNRMWGCPTDIFSPPRAIHDRALPITRSIAFSRANHGPAALRPPPGQTPTPTSLNRMWGCYTDVFSPPRAIHDRAIPSTRSIAFLRASHDPTALRPPPSQTPTPTSLNRTWGCSTDAFSTSRPPHARLPPRTRSIAFSLAHHSRTALKPQTRPIPVTHTFKNVWASYFYGFPPPGPSRTANPIERAAARPRRAPVDVLMCPPSCRLPAAAPPPPATVHQVPRTSFMCGGCSSAVSDHPHTIPGRTRVNNTRSSAHPIDISYAGNGVDERSRLTVPAYELVLHTPIHFEPSISGVRRVPDPSRRLRGQDEHGMCERSRRHLRRSASLNCRSSASFICIAVPCMHSAA